MVEHPDTDDVQAPDPLRVVTLVLVAAMVLAVAGLIFYLVTFVREQRQTAECYQKALTELNTSLAVSREAARQDRAELRTLVTSITDPAKTSQERRDALDRYAAALDAADRDRAAAPLPTRTCS